MNEKVLHETALAMVAKGKGILAADESTGTIKKRFDKIGVENTEANRQAYRDMLFTTPGFEQHTSGVILFEETLFQKSLAGPTFAELLTKKGVIPGIKVDKGAQPLAGGGLEETVTEGLDGLRYNKVVIATDADVDGMHIRLLLISFFLQFFPDLIRNGHLFILDTPLFRVRNKKKTIYCYSEQEKQTAVSELGATHEITRFKGLGEISAGEFKDFIGENIRLDPLTLNHLHNSDELLTFFMGKNTPERQDFIIGNLRIEKDLVAV